MIVNYLLIKVYQLLWFLLHFIYRWQFDIRESLHINCRKVIQRLSSCLPPYSYYGELAKLTKSSEKLRKIPKHIAFSVIENPRLGHNEEPIEFQMLARVISWAWVARIPVVSLYDYHGRIKGSYRELGCYIQEELIQNYWALKKHGRANDLPTIKFHNVPKTNGYSNGSTNGYCNGLSNGQGSNGVKSSNNPLHIVVFSNEDGKPEIVRTAKEIYFEQLSNKFLVSSGETEHSNDDDAQKKKLSLDLVQNIDESTIDSILNRVFSWPNSIAASPEPDMLVILGNIQSTLGFLPWHIRLTEIHWLPKLEIVEIQDFFQVLKDFSRCQQRFGA